MPFSVRARSTSSSWSRVRNQSRMSRERNLGGLGDPGVLDESWGLALSIKDRLENHPLGTEETSHDHSLGFPSQPSQVKCAPPEPRSQNVDNLLPPIAITPMEAMSKRYIKIRVPTPFPQKIRTLPSSWGCGIDWPMGARPG